MVRTSGDNLGLGVCQQWNRIRVVRSRAVAFQMPRHTGRCSVRCGTHRAHQALGAGGSSVWRPLEPHWVVPDAPGAITYSLAFILAPANKYLLNDFLCQALGWDWVKEIQFLSWRNATWCEISTEAAVTQRSMRLHQWSVPQKWGPWSTRVVWPRHRGKRRRPWDLKDGRRWWVNAVGDGVRVKEASVLIKTFPLVSGHKARLFLLAS